jgi:hypothetical protein
MGLPLLRTCYTVEEYLALERESEERHAYLDGDIYAMAGESPEHGAICMNLYGSLWPQLRGTPCQAFAKDMKVRSGRLSLPGHAPPGAFQACLPPRSPRQHDLTVLARTLSRHQKKIPDTVHRACYAC